MEIKKNYKDFGEEDFINDERFQDWVLHREPENDSFWQTFIVEHPGKKEAIETAARTLTSIEFKEVWPAEHVVESSLRKTLEKIGDSGDRITDKNRSKLRSLYQRWWAAAIFLLVLGSGLFLVGRNKEVQNPGPVVSKSAATDIAPGSNKAILTLADGSQVMLDSTANDTLTNQGGTTIIKIDGQLAYKPAEGEGQGSMIYNTITTPRGGQYQLVLGDGTKVWLNAASSLRFPTVFSGIDRSVELTGEGYFEVAKNPSKPFYVKTGNLQVEVLGTHFNVSAYADEASVRTTLLEGSVKVSQQGEEKTLKPGQQALWFSNAEGPIQVNYVNTDEVVAWKNGYFSFHNAGITNVMQQLSRWYDIEVEYTGAVPTVKFSGDIGRTLSLQEVLSILEDTRVRHRLEGRKLTILH